MAGEYLRIGRDVAAETTVYDYYRAVDEAVQTREEEKEGTDNELAPGGADEEPQGPAVGPQGGGDGEQGEEDEDNDLYG